MSYFESTLAYWQQTPYTFIPEAWQTFINDLSPLKFTAATLEIDAALWGGFWQGDVIAPGYMLPALELAFLRATRLDNTFTETTPNAFLKTLQTTLTGFPDGAWLTQFGPSQGLCVAYLEPADQMQSLLIWLANGEIIAGYRDGFIDVLGYQLLPIRSVVRQKSLQPDDYLTQESWLSTLLEWREAWPNWDYAMRVDRLMILHRAYGSTKDVKVKEAIEMWLESLDWA